MKFDKNFLQKTAIFQRILSRIQPPPIPKIQAPIKLADLRKDRVEAISDVEFEQTQEWQDFIKGRKKEHNKNDKTI
jgi:hypothetical protein